MHLKSVFLSGDNYRNKWLKKETLFKNLLESELALKQFESVQVSKKRLEHCILGFFPD